MMDVLFRCAYLCTCLIFVQGQVSEKPHAIRLVGPSAYIGQVQILHGNQWLSICKDNWNLINAHVVCRELGYAKAISAKSFNYTRSDGDQGATVRGFTCRGNETRLDLCKLCEDNWTPQECGKDYAGVLCQTPTETSHPVRLVDGKSVNEGRVEIKHSNEWTTVCDAGWDKPDADIICHQLGYGKAVRTRNAAYFGQGSGTILLSNVSCKEDDLRFRFDVRYCNVTTWYPGQECTHAHDAGVECDIKDTPLEVRLSGAQNNAVQIKFNEDWMSVCDDNWNMKDAHVVCRQLGYQFALAAPPTGYHGWQGYYLRNFFCNGSEPSLDRCKSRGGWNLQVCGNPKFAGVKCFGVHDVERNSKQTEHNKGFPVNSVIGSTVAGICIVFFIMVYLVRMKVMLQRRTVSIPTYDETGMDEIIDCAAPNQSGITNENPPLVNANLDQYVTTRDDVMLLNTDER